MCFPNPGEMGIGIYFENGLSISKKAGKGTNNQAEYKAVLKALREAEKKGYKDIKILTDSKLISKQISGNWKIKDTELRKLNSKIQSLIQKFESFEIEWIPRERNKKADKLSKKALGYEIKKVPSESKEGKFYEVVLKNGKAKNCSCPHYQYRNVKCKHMKKAEKLANSSEP